MSHLFNPDEDTRRGSYYNGYLSLATSGREEPMSTHADHYKTNYAYGAASYSKGAVFVAQLGYVIGDKPLKEGLLRYFDEWKFKHPAPIDFMRVMEKTSGMHLGWYLNYMVNTTEIIDYGIKGLIVDPDGKNTLVELERLGNFPMPIDLDITLRDGSKRRINIPLASMRESKSAEDNIPFLVMDPWPWTNPVYILELDVPIDLISKIEIDESMRLADVNRENNLINLEQPAEVPSGEIDQPQNEN
jgi:hypothetical protein